MFRLFSRGRGFVVIPVGEDGSCRGQAAVLVVPATPGLGDGATLAGRIEAGVLVVDKVLTAGTPVGSVRLPAAA
jgi:hypothetical protein